VQKILCIIIYSNTKMNSISMNKDTLIVQHLLILLRTMGNSRVSIHSRKAPDFDISFSLKITELS